MAFLFAIFYVSLKEYMYLSELTHSVKDKTNTTGIFSYMSIFLTTAKPQPLAPTKTASKDTPPPNQGLGESGEACLLFVHRYFLLLFKLENIRLLFWRSMLGAGEICKVLQKNSNLVNIERGHTNEIILGYPLCWPKKWLRRAFLNRDLWKEKMSFLFEICKGGLDGIMLCCGWR